MDQLMISSALMARRRKTMRLIDADSLLEQLPVHPDGGMRSVKDSCLMVRVRKTVEDAPTVAWDTNVPNKGWISVKDRMPDKPCGCLVFNIYGWRALDRWEGYGWVLAKESEVTHWMPLPEPPKEDANG